MSRKTVPADYAAFPDTTGASDNTIHESETTVYQALTVAKMDPANAESVSALFAASDNTDLPHLIGVTRRTLFAFHGLYFHLAESDQDFESNLEKTRNHPLFREINSRLGHFLSPFDPSAQNHKDALAIPFYSWTPAEGSQVRLPAGPASAQPPTRAGQTALKVSVGEVPANTKRGGDIRVTLSPKTAGCTSGFGGRLHLAPGEFVTEHYHPHSEEFLHLVQGEVEISLDGKPMPLLPGDSLLVPIGVRHRLVNTGNVPAEAVFHLSPLAPRPELGHVDTEEPLHAEAGNPDIEGAR